AASLSVEHRLTACATHHSPTKGKRSFNAFTIRSVSTLREPLTRTRSPARISSTAATAASSDDSKKRALPSLLRDPPPQSRGPNRAHPTTLRRLTAQFPSPP